MVWAVFVHPPPQADSLQEVMVDDGPGHSPCWRLMSHGRVYNPTPVQVGLIDPAGVIDGALALAQRDITPPHTRWLRAEWGRRVLRAPMHQWAWGLGVLAGLGGWGLATLGDRTIPLWGQVFPELLQGVGGLEVRLVVAGLSLGFGAWMWHRALDLRLARLWARLPALPRITWAPVAGRAPFPWQDTSATLAFLLAYLEWVCQREQERGAPMPGWGEGLLEHSPGCVASAAVLATGGLASVGQWKDKLAAILNHPASRRVILAAADRPAFDDAWQKRGNPLPPWDKDRKSGCWRVCLDPDVQTNRRLECLACPDVWALLHCLDSHRGGYSWAAVRLLLTGLAILPFGLPLCPTPWLELSLPGQMWRFTGESAVPQVQVTEAGVEMHLRAEGCAGTVVHLQAEATAAEAPAEVLKVTTLGPPRSTFDKQVVIGAPGEVREAMAQTRPRQTRNVLHQAEQEEKLLLQMSPQASVVHLTLAVAPANHCRQEVTAQVQLVHAKRQP